jgi:divalent metal cation (Fe/Co/Zn/Cd) transporter
MGENDRTRDLDSAIVASWLTVGWDVVAGTLAIVTAVATGSVALAAFGLDAAIDGAASVMLIRRFRAERRHAHLGEAHERQALVVVGAALLTFGVLVAAVSINELLNHTPSEVSGFAMAQAAVSAIVLPPLAYRKHTLAKRLHSRALRGDSILTGAGAVLALLAFVGLGLKSAFGWWWADPIAALLITIFLIWEGRRAVATWLRTRGEV